MPDSARRSWLTVALLFFCAGLNYGDRTAISSVFPLLQAEFGMTDVQLGELGSFFLWSYALGSPFAGMLADRFSRRKLIAGSLAAWSLATLATGFAQSATQLLAIRAVLGLSECAYLPAAVGLIADHHGPLTRGRALGVHLAGLQLGLIAGGSLAGYLGQHGGWRQPFFVLGAAGLLLSAICAVFLEDVAEPHAAPKMDAPLQIRRLLSRPLYQLILVEAMLVSVGTWMFYNWMPLYFSETFHMSLAAAGFSGTALLQAAAMLAVLCGSALSDAVAKQSESKRLLLMAVFYLASAPFLLIFAVKNTFTWVSVAVILFAFLRAMGGANEPPILCGMLPARERSTAQGLMNTLNALAGGIGIFAAGWLKKDFGLGGVFAGVSILMALAAVVALAAYRLRRFQIENPLIQ